MSIFSNLKDKITRYGDAYIRLIKINFIERTSALMGHFIFLIVCLFITLAILLFLGLGMTEVFAAMVDSRIGGFFITIGLYLILLAVVVFMRKKLIRFFSNGFIRILTDHDTDEDKENNNNKQSSLP